MITQCLCSTAFLLSFTYEKDITLYARDTIITLADPIKVVEKNDIIILFNQEGK